VIQGVFKRFKDVTVRLEAAAAGVQIIRRILFDTRNLEHSHISYTEEVTEYVRMLTVRDQWKEALGSESQVTGKN
jgi:hypothetical protein